MFNQHLFKERTSSMSTPVSILPPPKHNKFSLNLIRTFSAALVAVAFMGWGSSYAQSSGGGKNPQATAELLAIAQYWCPMEAEGDGVNKDVQRLLAAGADINAVGEDGRTVLMNAVRAWEYGTAKLLIDRGADINATDDEGRTVLMWALMSGGSCPAMKGFMGVDTRSVRLLLEKGANPKVAAKDGTTALSIAADDQKLSRMVKAAIDNYGSGKKLELNSGIDAVDANEETALMRAVNKGDVASVKSLLEKGAGVDMTDAQGNTPLMRAAEKGNTTIIEALLRHGANVNAEDTYGMTALSLAVREGRADAVKILLGKKAKIDVTIYDAPCGESLLNSAVSQGNANIVKLLIDAGANVNGEHMFGMCAVSDKGLLSAAEGHPEIVRILKAAGAKEKPAGD